MDENQLAQLYQQYLGRAPDPSGIATWSGQDPSAVIAGIMGSPEYQSRGGGGGGDTGGGGGGGGGGGSPEQILNQAYQDVFGRAPDPSAQGWLRDINAGLDLQGLKNILATTPEAREKALQGVSPVVGQNDPNNFVSNINQLYMSSLGRLPDKESLVNNLNLLNQNPDAFGWLAQSVVNSPEAQNYSQKTGIDQNAVYSQVTGDYGKWTPAASSPTPGGLGGLFMKYGPYLPFIAAAAASAPALLAAEGAAAGSGFVGLDAATASQLGLSGGSALGTAGAAGDVLAGIYGAEAAAGISQALPYTEAYDAINLIKQGINPSQIADILTISNPALDPFIAYDIANMAANGLSESAIQQALQYGYGASELASMGLESMLPAVTGANALGSLAGPLSAIGKGALTSAGKMLAGNLLGGGTRAPMGGYLPGGGTNINIQQPQTIPNLQAGIVRGQPIDLDMPEFNQQLTPIEAAAGGSIDSDYEDSNYSDTVSNLAKLKPNLMKGKSDFNLQKYWDSKYAEGGEVEHNPEFFSEGGLQNRYVKGAGDGTSDDVPAMLANGEFVIPADVVSDLGNGSNDSGAELLDEFLQVIREHKRKADAKHLPPDSKGPLGYLLEAKHKVR